MDGVCVCGALKAISFYCRPYASVYVKTIKPKNQCPDHNKSKMVHNSEHCVLCVHLSGDGDGNQSTQMTATQKQNHRLVLTW